MSVRKTVLLCVLVVTMALPLFGCGGSSSQPAGSKPPAGSGAAAPASSNTTAE
jgi:uncharacterized spore protein YtfJ